MSGGGGGKINSVFYADTYHPIQAGSIDGTDIAPHDNAVYRALLCYNARLYDPFGDPKVIGDPYCTVFVGRLSHQTTEETLLRAMSKYGKVKNLRLVRHIVTGASRGYAFVEYETEREMRRAYEYAHHSIVDDSEIIIDFNRQQLMPGWIPRRLGGGLGGKKESGQLRFGGRERPFRAPLRPIPFDDLKRLGILPPPEGRYMSRFQIPSPPRRKRNSVDRDDRSSDPEDISHKHHGHKLPYRRERSISRDNLYDENRQEPYHKPHKHSRHSHQRERSISHSYDERSSVDGKESSHKRRERSVSEDHYYDEMSPMDGNERSHKRRERSVSKDAYYDERGPKDGKECSHKRHERSVSEDHYYDERSPVDGKEHSHKRHKCSEHYKKQERKHTGQGRSSDLKGYANREEHSRKDHRRSRHSYQHERMSS